MAQKVRLDKLLLDRGLVRSRERAKALILSGQVWVAGQRVDKAGAQVDINAPIELKTPDHPYVSRGGLKLEAALQTFQIVLTNKVAMDIGASTGGFTDCLLQHGAKKVYAIDVGYGLLDWQLRQDKRVIPIERQNIRYLPREAIPEPIDIITIDVSFISLRKVIPKGKEFLKSRGELIALIKPQFEVGKGEVGKGGIVRDENKRQQVVKEISDFCERLGFEVKGVIPSPILGTKGNQEYLLYAKMMVGSK
ncbi:MAG: TlyA family RNA methyltransferase [Candidatus Desulfofervidaceae bacterium]|nr:TlyA family RNA methyltransferase [Candidatus Desulfofervidaceae bacterium]